MKKNVKDEVLLNQFQIDTVQKEKLNQQNQENHVIQSIKKSEQKTKISSIQESQSDFLIQQSQQEKIDAQLDDNKIFYDQSILNIDYLLSKSHQLKNSTELHKSLSFYQMFPSLDDNLTCISQTSSIISVEKQKLSIQTNNKIKRRKSNTLGSAKTHVSRKQININCKKQKRTDKLIAQNISFQNETVSSKKIIIHQETILKENTLQLQNQYYMHNLIGHLMGTLKDTFMAQMYYLINNQLLIIIKLSVIIKIIYINDNKNLYQNNYYQILIKLPIIPNLLKFIVFLLQFQLNQQYNYSLRIYAKLNQSTFNNNLQLININNKSSILKPFLSIILQPLKIKINCMPIRVYFVQLNLTLKKYDKMQKTLVIDLDETLVHCNEFSCLKNDFFISVIFNEQIYQVGISIRPYAQQFLRNMAKDYEIIIFTASNPDYANKIIDYLDPQCNLVSYRLFRDDCIQISNNCHIKDLRILNRNMKDIILVDNSAYSFAFQVENGIPIIPYLDDKNDKELLYLENYLQQLNQFDDVRSQNNKIFNLKTVQNCVSIVEAIKQLSASFSK